jgi:lysine-specific demethylase 3
VWDICPRGKPAQQLGAFLQDHAADFTHQGVSITPKHLPVVGVNAVFSQAFMLSQRHRQQLHQETGLELWHFEQHRGEAVFIPGGCPHQVRNLASCCKVSQV